MKKKSAPEIKVPSVDVHSPLMVEERPLELQKETSLDKKNKGLFVGGIVVCLIILIATVSVAVFRFRMGQEKPVTVQENQNAVITQPVFNKKDFVFEVLNGSGRAGEAKKAADILQSLGFDVIKVGNADSSQNKTTVVLDKKLFNQADPLLQALQKDFKVATVSGDLTNTTASAQLIIGSE
jgi:hypothetical protein